MCIANLDNLKSVGNLAAKGFTLTPQGWARHFVARPDNPDKRTEFTLYLFQDQDGAGACGVAKNPDGSHDPLVFDTWAFRLSTRDGAAYKEAAALVDELIAEGLITLYKGAVP